MTPIEITVECRKVGTDKWDTKTFEVMVVDPADMGEVWKGWYSAYGSRWEPNRVLWGTLRLLESKG